MTEVAVQKCERYDPELVEAAMRRAVDSLGGMERFVKPGDRVFLKVNLLRSSRPDQAVVTHPSVVRAAVRLLQEAGGVVIIGDSPSGTFNVGVLRRAYKMTGYEAVARDTGATLNLNTNSVHLANPRGKLIKRFEVMQAVVGADAIVTLPKLKTHVFTHFTGATKILFGLIPGVTKVGYHTKLQNVERFSEMLIDLLGLLPPRLAIMDAVVGMDGDGPSGGRPRPVGLIMASPDSVALDVVATTVVDIKPLSVPILRAAADRGLTRGYVSDSELRGERLKDVQVADFLPAQTSRLDLSRLPGFLRRWVTDQLVVRPVANPARCTGCGTCFVDCPVKAITMADGVAVVDPGICIRCYCCHEFCPDRAIDLVPGRVSLFFTGKER